jgi:hypothetical protein
VILLVWWIGPLGATDLYCVSGVCLYHRIPLEFFVFIAVFFVFFPKFPLIREDQASLEASLISTYDLGIIIFLYVLERVPKN